jgi:hypothetical protein
MALRQRLGRASLFLAALALALSVGPMILGLFLPAAVFLPLAVFAAAIGTWCYGVPGRLVVVSSPGAS